MSKIIRILSIDIDNLSIRATIEIDGNNEEIITSLNEECIHIICIDRIDAYIIGLMYFALKNRYDFESLIPISESLYYNLNEIFIDTLIQGNPTLHKVKIRAPLIKDINTKSDNIIATGISCGVDSLYTIAKHSSNEIPSSLKLNSLCFFNVGAAFKSQDDLELINGRLSLAKSFAKEYGYRFIQIESNLHLIIHKYSNTGYSHIENHTYMALFCIFCIQYGVSKYLYSSGYSISEFTTKNLLNKEFDSAHYDLLTLNIASVNNMKFYSTGGNVSRIEKIKLLSTYPPAFKYLNVCVNEINNDNICFKCERTLLEIDAVGNIDDFKSVFNVTFYKKNKNKYLSALYKNAILKKNPFYIEIYPFLKNEITLLLKAKTIFSIIKNKLVKW